MCRLFLSLQTPANPPIPASDSCSISHLFPAPESQITHGSSFQPLSLRRILAVKPTLSPVRHLLFYLPSLSPQCLRGRGWAEGQVCTESWGRQADLTSDTCINPSVAPKLPKQSRSESLRASLPPHTIRCSFLKEKLFIKQPMRNQTAPRTSPEQVWWFNQGGGSRRSRKSWIKWIQYSRCRKD